MKPFLRRVFVAVCAAVLAAMPLASRAARREPHVILITLDGFAADYLDDPRLPIPNLRAMAAEGAHAKRMTVSTPSVTWPNHTTLVTGVTPARHGVLANGILEPTAGGLPYHVNAVHTRDEMCRVPTLYDLAHAAGMRTAEINWPVTRGSKALDNSFPDHPNPISNSTPALVQDLVSWNLISAPTNQAFLGLGAVGRDRVWTQAAVRLIQRDRPNFLLLHLLNTDGQQHGYGPQSTEAYTALSLADRYVGDVRQAIHAASLDRDTTLIVTADHGFVRVTKLPRPNFRMRERGLIRDGANGKLEWDAQCLSEGGIGLVYLRRRGDAELTDRVQKALTGLEGIDRIVTPKDYAEFGLPDPRTYPQSPDLVLGAANGYAFGEEATGPEVEPLEKAVGSHGYLQTNSHVDAILFLAGRKVRKGAVADRVRNLDVAPTVARLLDLRMENVEGSPLNTLVDAR